MKKFLALAGATICLVPSVYATKPRLEGMSESVSDGTFYIDDNRSIFRNPAYINNFSNRIIAEWGRQATATAGANNADSGAAPKGEGGLLVNQGAYNYGIYLGNESNTSNMLRLSAHSGASSFNKQDNTMEAFFGGGDTMKWGVSAYYHHYKDEQSANATIEDKSSAIGVGVLTNQYEAYVKVPLGTEASDKNDKFDGKFGIHTGGSYFIGENGRAFLSYKKFTWDIINTGVKTEAEYSRIDTGYGYTRTMGKHTLYTSLRFHMVDVEIKYAAGAATFKENNVPLNVGYEYNANSWLTVRGGIKQYLTGKVDQKNLSSVNTIAKTMLAAGFGNSSMFSDGKATFVNSTTVNAGATLMLGDVDIDGVLGTAASYAKDGKFNLNTAMARVGMTYKF